jgi:hypothetical protein
VAEALVVRVVATATVSRFAAHAGQNVGSRAITETTEIARMTRLSSRVHCAPLHCLRHSVEREHGPILELCCRLSP